MGIVVPRSVENALRREAERAYPEECCGLLAGDEAGGVRAVHDLLPLPNMHADERRRRCLILPEQYRAAERQAETRGLALVGFYHSHPDRPARPSAFDRAHALPWWSYVVVGVERGRAAAMGSFRLAEDRGAFLEEPVFAAPPRAGSVAR